MPSSTDFASYAGQLVQGGTRTKPQYEPAIALEEGADAKTLDKIPVSISGLIPKIAKISILPTRIFASPLDPYIRRETMPWGVGHETAAFVDGAANHVNSGRCVPRGEARLAADYAYVNFAWDQSITVYDREVADVMPADQASDYVAQKMRTPVKTQAVMRYLAWKQLISDIVDGTRKVASTTSSAGSETSIDYSPTIKGYAGKVIDAGISIGTPARGSALTATADDARSLINQTRSVARDLMYEGSDYVKLGVVSHCEDAPLCIMEAKTLDALDQAALAAQGPYSGSWTSTPVRDSLRQFSTLVELDAFAPLPTATATKGKRLGAVLIDRTALLEETQTSSIESQRCCDTRSTGFSWQGSQVLSISKLVPSCAFTFTESA